MLTQNIENFIKAVNVKREILSQKFRESCPSWEGDYYAPLKIRNGMDGNWCIIDCTGSQTGVFCFIRMIDGQTKTLGVLKAGDIHKPAGYNAPAKKARASVFADDFGISCTEGTSIVYLR